MYNVAILTLIQAWMDKQWCCPGFFHVCGRHFTAVIQQCLVWFAMRKVVSCRNWPCTHLFTSHWSHFDVDSAILTLILACPAFLCLLLSLWCPILPPFLSTCHKDAYLTASPTVWLLGYSCAWHSSVATQILTWIHMTLLLIPIHKQYAVKWRHLSRSQPVNDLAGETCLMSQ